MVGALPIFVAIRGINYTDRATREVGKNIDFLVAEQQKLRQQSVQLLAAGLMWVTFAGLAIAGITKIMDASAEGHRALASFNRATNELMKGLGEAFTKVLGPTIQMLTTFFRVLSQNKAVLQLVASLGTVAVALILVMGISKMMTAAWQYMMGSMVLMGTVSFQTANTMTVAFARLQAAMGPIVMGLMLGAQMAALLGENAWAIIPVIVALTIAFTALSIILHKAALGMAMLTWGASAAIGAAAYIASMATTPSYQVGTEYATRTTTAIVQEGEKITPARERASQENRETSRPFPVRHFEFNMNGVTIQTKADKEELRPFILKTVRDAVDEKV